MTSIPLRRTLLACAATASLLLTACGGGGGFEAPPSAQSLSAEGAWVGSLSGSTATSAHALVLENGEFWVAYGNPGETLAITGFVQGQGTSDKGLFSASNARDFALAAPADMKVDATYVRNSRFVGALDNGVGFNAKPWALTVTDAATDPVYDYDAKASADDVKGDWVVQASDGLAYSVSVSGAGTLTGYARGCLVNGKLVPRASHKNVFDLSLTFGASPCVDAGGSYRGVVFMEPKKLTIAATEEDGFQLIGMAVNSDRTKGFALSAAYKNDRTRGVTVSVGW